MGGTEGFGIGLEVEQRLRGDEGDLLNDLLVGVEVEGQFGVVLLNQDLGGLLDGLGTDAAHLGRWKMAKFVKKITSFSFEVPTGKG